MLQRYVVQPGDTLVSIAKKVYGEEKAFTDIYRANEDVILDPYNLQPGTVLYIPPPAEMVHRSVHAHPTASAPKNPRRLDQK
ncbi:MAG: LysM peptidoglycan-binding domain-containing protein [Chloroflexi bacterium]|nr:LysM peptidoglycan-binding domain-containing protein [Chloroflexota bacterium]